MFFLALLNAVSRSLGVTSIFRTAALAIRRSWRMRSFRRLSLAVSVSSSDSVCDSSRDRRYAFSTSCSDIFRPSTTAQVSGDTGGAGGGVERHAAVRDRTATAVRMSLRLVIRRSSYARTAANYNPPIADGAEQQSSVVGRQSSVADGPTTDDCRLTTTSPCR